MKIRNVDLWKIILVGLSGAVIWGFSRGLVFKKWIPVQDPQSFVSRGDSFFVQNNLFFPILGVMGLIVLSLYVTFFVLLEKNLPGNKFFKGFIYGSCFFLIYMAAFFEFYHFFDDSQKYAFLSGLADGIPLLITAVLSGVFFGTSNTVTGWRSPKYLAALLFIPIFFVLGRILFYTVIYPSPLTFNPDSLLILFIYGAAIALAYYIISRGITVTNSLLIPFAFALILFPISLSGNLVICWKYNFPFYIMILLTLIDTAAIIIGALITEAIFRKSAG